MNINANIPLIEQVSSALRDHLGDDFDAETFWDTLDGETDAVDLMDRVIADASHAKAMEEAIRLQVEDLSVRKARMSDRQKAAKVAMLMILDASGEKKIERPAATVSRRTGSISVQIEDETAIPSQLCKTTIAPDKAAIKKQLQAGGAVPGASLQRGPDGVTVRVV